MSIGFIKKALNTVRQESRHRTYRVNQWFKWLAPGLSVKRWLLISAGGVVLASLGLAIWIKLTPIFKAIQFIEEVLGTLANILPSYVSGPLVLLCGLLLIFWGQTQTLSSITKVLRTDGDEELIDVLLAHRRLHRGPKIVAIAAVRDYRLC